MSGFLWSEDEEGFFGNDSSGDSTRSGKKSSRAKSSPGASSESPLSVTQLNEWIKKLLTQSIPTVWVSGEIGNLVQSSAGHVYFTLKDASGQLAAVLWRSTWEKLGIDLREGMAVILQGRIDVYAPRGTYQIVVQKIEEQGVGALQAAFRRLFAKLQKEGLFEPERKKLLPRFPQRIGFVTSPSGAAIHDFAQVLRRRWPLASVLIIPAKVQGDGAAEEIARGIEVAAVLRPALDVLVVGRGGGSLEDLWAFNEEVVVRAVAACPIPTISAVGHEIDVTLCDLAADVRALTPSEAAERVAPSRDEFVDYLDNTRERLALAVQGQWDRAAAKLESLSSRPILEDPDRLLELPTQRLDEVFRDLDNALDRRLEQSQQQLERFAQVVDALSPLKTLSRGYSLTTRSQDGSLVSRSTDIEIGESVVTQLAEGRIVSTVTERLA
ncbi:exodeoxyribonuclease VII large subunit [Pirellulaceae bacterium SH501]